MVVYLKRFTLVQVCVAEVYWNCDVTSVLLLFSTRHVVCCTEHNQLRHICLFRLHQAFISPVFCT